MKTVTVASCSFHRLIPYPMDSVKKNQSFSIRQAEFFAANACEQPALYKQRAGCTVLWNHREYWLEGFSDCLILLYYYE
jgi:hypothetical protein